LSGAASGSILFWGAALSRNKPLKKTLPFLLTIQSAAILPSNDPTPIVLKGRINDSEFRPFCTLHPTSVHQISLGIVLEPDLNIEFQVEGKGDIYLTGYFHLRDVEEDGEELSDALEQFYPNLEKQSSEEEEEEKEEKQKGKGKEKEKEANVKKTENQAPQKSPNKAKQEKQNSPNQDKKDANKGIKRKGNPETSPNSSNNSKKQKTKNKV
jgi:hypothetical protein